MQDSAAAAVAPPSGRAPGAREATAPVLEIAGLSVAYQTRTRTVHAVRDVSLAVRAGETLGIVGESGSGKSTLAFAVMGYLGEAGQVTAGAIRLHGDDLARLPAPALRRLRGARMAMVYQDPQTALNPSITVGEQVAEARRAHTGDSPAAARRRSLELLRRVGLPDPERIAGRYPHQLSGGQQQRVVIAMALINDPDLLIMDEPTTGLDVTTEALILDLVNDLKRDSRAAILYISHNLGVIAQVCDRVAVMYAGEVVEEADVARLFRAPRHPYTVGLLGCLPRLGAAVAAGSLRPIPGRLPAATAAIQGCVFAPRCALAQDACRDIAPPAYPAGAPQHTSRCHFWEEVPAFQAAQATATASSLPIGAATAPAPAAPLLEVRGLSRYYGTRDLLAKLLQPITGRQRRVRAVEQVSFDLLAGETLALVGESGCGKTTLARTLAGLDAPTAGSVRFLGHDVTCTADRRPAGLRRHLQMVFQNPDASLNPRHTAGQIVSRPANLFLGLRGEAARRHVMELLLSVGLDPGYYDRYPSQLSGGEKQRVSIARAFAGEPQLVICDEAVSALDVSVQATILNLLAELQRKRGTSYLFISHDLGVVQYLADRIGVMYLGRLVELGHTEDIMQGPQHPYTEALLSAIPVPDPAAKPGRIRLHGPVPSPTARPAGCPFAGRCPRYLGRVCDDVPPPAQDADNGHTIACHIPIAQLATEQRSRAAAPERAGAR